MKLNLGCGNRPKIGHVNVDMVKMGGVDFVHNLDNPWPWQDGSAERIEAEHVFEHVISPVTFMTEAYRVLKLGGILHIITPHYQHPDSFTDPMHLRHCTEHSFDYWIPGTLYCEENYPAYGEAAFRMLNISSPPMAWIDITLQKIKDPH